MTTTNELKINVIKSALYMVHELSNKRPSKKMVIGIYPIGIRRHGPIEDVRKHKPNMKVIVRKFILNRSQFQYQETIMCYYY